MTIDILTAVVKTATVAVELKRLMLKRKLHQDVSRQLYLEQFAATTKELEKALAPVVEAQVDDYVRGLHSGTKQFCPTGPGGGVDPTCSPGGGKTTPRIAFRIDGEDRWTTEEFEAEFTRISNLLFSRVPSSSDIAKLANIAEDDKTGYVEVSMRGDSLDLFSYSDSIDNAARRITRDSSSGETVLHNLSFMVEDSVRNTGIGAQSFHRQVETAASLGVSRISTFAEGAFGDDANGYYTWPRLGYDSKPIAVGLLREDPPASLQLGVTARVSDFMKTAEGREYWKRYGTPQDLVFDLKPGSQSREVLNAYIKERSRRATAKSYGGGRRDLGRDLGSNWEKGAGKEIDWTQEFKRAAFPVLADAMMKAATAQFLQLGVDIRKRGGKTASASINVKSTATDWLDRNELTLPSDFVSDMPRWMQDNIAKQLKESFDQDYWEGMAQTTQDDIETVLRTMSEGESISSMAKTIKEKLGTEYYHNRARNIARTEAANALNGARWSVYDDLMREVGPQVPMKMQWLSVLGATTRDTHAHLDGVPADKDGLWYLGGKRIPWPGHYSLPPGERCNCQCTISIAFGMSEEEAIPIIQNYYLRRNDMEFGGQRGGVEDLWAKVFCPTGPGGGVDPTCSPGGGGGSGESSPAPLTERERTLVRTQYEKITNKKERLKIQNAWGEYTGGQYRDINTSLREDPKWYAHDWQDQIRALSKTFDFYAESLPRDATLFREVTSDVRDLFKVGAVYSDKGFVSTTTSVSMLRPDAQTLILHIRAKKGTKVVSGTDAEHELVLARDSRFTVTKVEDNSVYLELL